MQIVFNGTQREIEEQISVAALLAQLNLLPKHVAVEVNREIVPRAQHAMHQLRAGDEVEVVTLVGGG